MFVVDSVCISPQKTFLKADLSQLELSAENKLKVIEPANEGIPLNTLRRMGKAVRLGVGAALPLTRNYTSLNGIIIGTANGGMEDCIKFLNQIIQFNEGTLTPTNFVQSTSNAIAAQIGLTVRNTSYNITHVHRGLAFENAMIDAKMKLDENPSHTFLLGGVDEISTYNFNIENLGGWYKKNTTSNAALFSDETNGSIAGEGVAMFITSNKKENAYFEIAEVTTMHTQNISEVNNALKTIIDNYGMPDLFLSGENGDKRLNNFYNAVEKILTAPVARFKHLCGEYPTASSFAVWLAGHILKTQTVSSMLLKSTVAPVQFNKILVYNTYKGIQHSFILLQKA